MAMVAQKLSYCSWAFLFSLCVASSPLDLELVPCVLSSLPSFLSNHALLLSSFKVFIYPPVASHAHYDPRSLALPPQNAEELFLHSLFHSSFVTHDAKSADLFLVPVSLAAMRLDANRALGRSLRSLVQQLRDLYPYWDRTLGADHFVTGCRRFKADSSRNVLELQKNSIWLACSELFGAAEQNASQSDDQVLDSQFYPHKDITMPPFNPQVMEFSRRNSGNEEQDRRILVYVMDQDHPADPWLKRLKRDRDFLFASHNDDYGSRFANLSTSKFCLAFGSLGRNVTVVHAMSLGCVPVFVSNGHMQGLPFQDILDWQQFSIVASLSRLRKLKPYLAAISEGEYREMQIAAMAASRHLEWHTSPKPYDAFYMLMHQLWLRRHTIRYSQRSVE